MKDIINYLTKLDFSKIEIKLYLTLLRYGPLTVAQLADKTKVNRTSAYTYINSLFKKGVLIKTKSTKNEIAATSPDNLRYLVENKIATTKELEANLHSVINKLSYSSISSGIQKEAETTYYKGLSGIKAIHLEAFATEEVRVYVNLAETDKVMKLEPQNLDLFERALAGNKKLKIYEIITDSPDSVAKYSLEKTAQSRKYFYKFMPALDNFNAACVLIYNNKVAIINLKDDIDSVVLHNPSYFKLSKQLFDFNWNILPEKKV